MYNLLDTYNVYLNKIEYVAPAISHGLCPNHWNASHNRTRQMREADSPQQKERIALHKAQAQ
jgi:hypothetical protein